jgi:hypothetical protein
MNICQHHPKGRPHTQQKSEGAATKKNLGVPCQVKKLKKNILVLLQRRFISISQGKAPHTVKISRNLSY